MTAGATPPQFAPQANGKVHALELRIKAPYRHQTCCLRRRPTRGRASAGKKRASLTDMVVERLPERRGDFTVTLPRYDDVQQAPE